MSTELLKELTTTLIKTATSRGRSGCAWGYPSHVDLCPTGYLELQTQLFWDRKLLSCITLGIRLSSREFLLLYFFFPFLFLLAGSTGIMDTCCIFLTVRISVYGRYCVLCCGPVHSHTLSLCSIYPYYCNLNQFGYVRYQVSPLEHMWPKRQIQMLSPVQILKFSQTTHFVLTGNRVLALCRTWVRQAFHVTYSTYAQGGAILINKSIPCKGMYAHIYGQGAISNSVLDATLDTSNPQRTASLDYCIGQTRLL